jgi:hypothetical protein
MTTDKQKVKLLQGEENYATWSMDIKALLRRHKVWTYTQQVPPTATSTESAKYDEKNIEAADFITLTLSDKVKLVLSSHHFDSGYEMLKRLEERYAPKNETTFFTLYRQLLTSPDGSYDGSEDLITTIKTLNEKIDACKIELTSDKRALLVLIMATGRHDQPLAQLFSVTPDMTFDRAAYIIREKERNEASYHRRLAGGTYLTRKTNNYEKKYCNHCGKTHGPTCFKKNPEMAPEWYRKNNDNSNSSSVNRAVGL